MYPFFLFLHYFDAHNISSRNSAPKATTANVENAPPPSKLEPLKVVARPIVRPLRRAVDGSKAQLRRWWRPVLRYFEKAREHDRYGRRFQLRQVAEIDKQIGRVIDTLSAQGQLANNANYHLGGPW